MSKRVALYVRVSSKQHQTVNNQLADLRQFCQQTQWTIVQEYTDYTSGVARERPAFNEMLTVANQKQFEVLLFWSLDRFSREGVQKTIHYLQLLEANGIQFKSYTEQYIDSTGIFKEVIIALLATLAKQERLRLSERVKAGLKRARKEGRIGGRPTLKAEVIQQIKAPKQQKFSDRAVGKKLGISPRTVAKYRDIS